MKKNLMSVAFHPAMLALLLPLTGGCALHAQGAIRAPHVSFAATLPPPPPFPVVTVRANVPAPTATATIVATPPRVVANTSTATVETWAPAPARVTPATPPVPASVTPTTSEPVTANFGSGLSVYTVFVPQAPPPPPSVTIIAPATRPGHIWARPHYRWSGSRWIWTGGRWLTARANRDWIQAHYDAEQRVFIQGHWESRLHADRIIGQPSPIIVNPNDAVAPATSSAASPSSSVSAGASVNVGISAGASFSSSTR